MNRAADECYINFFTIIVLYSAFQFFITKSDFQYYFRFSILQGLQRRRKVVSLL